MKKNELWRILLFGLMTWVIPFLISFVFYKPGGELVVPLDLFKTIMVLVGGAVGLYLLYQIYRGGSPFPRAGILFGSAWFAINIALDLAVLLPLTQVPLRQYIAETGLRYLLIPLMSVAMDQLVRARSRP